jgi:hypothetical protein
VIPPGSTGMLVVSYQTDLSAVSPPSEGGSERANLTADVLAPVYSRAVTIPEQILGYTNATGVTITPSIASVNVTALGNLKSFTVTYTINVSSGVSGSFELQYLDACPTMIPLLVGYTASQLNASSFPDYSPFLQGCTGLVCFQAGSWCPSVESRRPGWFRPSSRSKTSLRPRVSRRGTLKVGFWSENPTIEGLDSSQHNGKRPLRILDQGKLQDASSGPGIGGRT